LCKSGDERWGGRDGVHRRAVEKEWYKISFMRMDGEAVEGKW
jgi:hypothetical protein